ncbi:hypothetical protein [Pseudomonas kuykendallii]|nr:hypothetical protein [Pseudomonas kuykendallii]
MQAFLFSPGKIPALADASGALLADSTSAMPPDDPDDRNTVGRTVAG